MRTAAKAKARRNPSTKGERVQKRIRTIPLVCFTCGRGAPIKGHKVCDACHASRGRCGTCGKAAKL